jgi:hypothetical protein
MNREPSSNLPIFRPTAHIRIRLRTPTRTRTTPALPLDVLGPVAGGFPLALAAVAVPAPGLTAEVPGLAARSLGFNNS